MSAGRAVREAEALAVIEAHPDWSSRRLAQLCDVSNKTVERLRSGPTVSVVYAIHAAEVGLTKIGRTTHGATNRLRSLQTSSPCILTLVAERPEADGPSESYLHIAYGSVRRHGEWFDLHNLIERGYTYDLILACQSIPCVVGR